MIKFKDILDEVKLVPRRSKEERQANYISVVNKNIQQYIKGGSKGKLDLNGISVERLPDNLKKVGGDLSLYGTSIKELPSGLKVGGNLYLFGTQITSLPSGLKVGGNLYLQGTQITSLLSGLEVSGYLYLQGTPISKKYTKEQLRKMLPNVRGEIYT